MCHQVIVCTDSIGPALRGIKSNNSVVMDGVRYSLSTEVKDILRDAVIHGADSNASVRLCCGGVPGSFLVSDVVWALYPES